MPKFKVHFVSRQSIEWVKTFDAPNQDEAAQMAEDEDPEMDDDWYQNWEDTEYGVDWVEPVKES